MFSTKSIDSEPVIEFCQQWWTNHIDEVGGMLLGKAGWYLGKIGKYYRNKTWHCSLVVSCSLGKNKSKSINRKGNLVEMKNVEMKDTWDFQADNSVYNPAKDWHSSVLQGKPFPSSYYAGRKAIDVIVNDDSDIIRQLGKTIFRHKSN